VRCDARAIERGSMRKPARAHNDARAVELQSSPGGVGVCPRRRHRAQRLVECDRDLNPPESPSGTWRGRSRHRRFLAPSRREVSRATLLPSGWGEFQPGDAQGHRTIRRYILGFDRGSGAPIRRPSVGTPTETQSESASWTSSSTRARAATGFPPNCCQAAPTHG